MVWHETEKPKTSSWNFTYLFGVMVVLFIWLAFSLVRLQIVNGGDYADRSAANSVMLSYDYPNRGVIMDRNGEILAENVPSNSLYLVVNRYYDDDGPTVNIKEDDLRATCDVVQGLIGENWREQAGDIEHPELSDWVVEQIIEPIEYNKNNTKKKVLISEILISQDVDNDTTIKLKALKDQVEGIVIREGNLRNYPGGEAFTHILGYTSVITAEDLDSLKYLGYDNLVAGNGYNDIVGRLGVERVYDEQLVGKKGLIAVEKDTFGNIVSSSNHQLEPLSNGDNLYLTIDAKAQQKLFEVMKGGSEKFDSPGAAAVIQNVNTGEILSIVTYPTYDNNLFVQGISHADYNKLLENPALPLLNRPISAQFPPGSTFKTIAAAAALDSGAITTDTIYVSKAGYTFSNGAPFQEYRNNSYGAVNVVDAIARSSNIFFCETIRNWNINELVPYYEKFGIGEYTGIDLYGEQPGRLPSPANKKALANIPGVTWLDEIWYPEGDGCNTVIGQGIGLVTPIQMSNWISAIANGGVLTTPHVGQKLVDSEGNKDKIVAEPIRSNFISPKAMEVTRKAMRSAVAGPKKSITALTDTKTEVAAKTGTAEFGAINEKGQYEHAHAWVTGFFPYEKPEYAFVILLEDGGESYFAAQLAREYIDWMVDEGYVE